MSVPIFWAANGHELLRVEPSGDEAQFKKHIQEICNIPTAMQRLERRDDGSYVLYVKLRGGCRRRVGAGLSCPCFGCQVGACSVQ